MKKLTVLMSMLMAMNVFAMQVSTKIHDIISPEMDGQEYLILAEDGLVYELALDKVEIDSLYEAKKSGLKVNLILDDNTIFKNALNERETVIGIELQSKSSLKSLKTIKEDNVPTPMDNYNATKLSSFDSAINLFNSMRTGSRWRSQCYNRAHVWSYEASQYQGVNLRKVWLFFTQKYIRNYRYKWWFHVTPAVWVDGVREDVMLDREFTRKPTEFTEWKNIFMHNNASCPEVKYYSHYRENQWEEDCFIIKSSKYYWQPFNIENLEKDGSQKTHWVDWEVNKAFSNGFGVRR